MPGPGIDAGGNELRSQASARALPADFDPSSYRTEISILPFEGREDALPGELAIRRTAGAFSRHHKVRTTLEIGLILWIK